MGATSTWTEGPGDTADTGSTGDAGTGGDSMGGTYGMPPTRVLFIGNSYTEVNALPTVMSELGNFEVEQHTPGSTSWYDHDNNPVVDDLIAEGWDFVVLQNQSSIPWLFQGDIDPSLLSLDAKIKAADAETVLFMTWSRNIPSQRFLQDMAVNNYYERHGAAVGATVAPVGRAWERAKRDPAVVLHNPDGSHPNENGTYLSACVIYTALTGESPIGLGDGGLAIDPALRAQLQQVAWDTHLARQRLASPEIGSWPLSTRAMTQDVVPANDLVFGDVDGTATQFGYGKYGGIPYFDGINSDYITIAFEAYRADWSVWVGPEALVRKRWAYRLDQQWGEMRASLYTDGVDNAAVLIYQVVDLSPGWHDFALTYDGATFALWVDAQQVASDTAEGDILYDVTPGKYRFEAIALGTQSVDGASSNEQPNNFFTGAMANVRLFDEALTQAELQDL